MCRMITYRVNIGYQYLGSLLHKQHEISSNARCLETAFYILTFYVLILYIYFNLNYFSDTVHH